MANASTIDRPPRKARDDVERVTAPKMAAHLDMQRQSLANLVKQGTLTQAADGTFNLTATRIAYLRHLRAARRSSPTAEAQAEHQRQKAKWLAMQIAAKAGETMLVEDHNAKTDRAIGIVLRHLSGWPARISAGDLTLRRKAEALVFELRRDIAIELGQAADEAGEAQ